MDENCWSGIMRAAVLRKPGLPSAGRNLSLDRFPRKSPLKNRKKSPSRSDRGLPVAINGKKSPGYDLIQKLNTLFPGNTGSGGMNDRGPYYRPQGPREIGHPAATVILTAHRDLESLVLPRQELAFKRTVDDKWSEAGTRALYTNRCMPHSTRLSIPRRTG